MSHSFAKLHIHLVFGTKQRDPVLHDTIRDSLHRYLVTAIQSCGCIPLLVNSVEDHVHILFELGRTVTISAVVENIKTTSSKWLKTQGEVFAGFRWQTGYGAFSVSASQLGECREYIANQKEHHKKQSFEAEYREALERHGVSFDEKYLWD